MVASVRAAFTRLVQHEGGPCLSLYQPTARAFPDSRQNPVRYRNQVKNLQRLLGEKYSTKEIEEMLRPFEALVDDMQVWAYPQDGLAVFSCPDFFAHYWLPRPVPEIVIAADSFHVKPLIRMFQTADSYQVLVLTRTEIRLYEGNRDGLDAVDLVPEVPRTIVDALGEELTEPYIKVTAAPSGPGAPSQHGHGSRKDEIDVDTERFFRVIDKAVQEHYSAPSQLPLVLAALPEHQGHFRRLSRNPFLLERGIAMDASGLAIEELSRLAWEVVEPYFHERTRALVEAYGAAAAKGLGTDDLNQAAAAALAGRVDSLLVEAERHVGGRIDPETGRIVFESHERPGVDDVLDDIAVAVMRTRGKVQVVPKAVMPTKSGLAAIFRY